MEGGHDNGSCWLVIFGLGESTMMPLVLGGQTELGFQYEKRRIMKRVTFFAEEMEERLSTINEGKNHITSSLLRTWVVEFTSLV